MCASTNVDAELNDLMLYARKVAEASPELAKSVHFNTRIGAYQYVLLAEEISRAIGPGRTTVATDGSQSRGRVLDWGAGFGQNTRLMTDRGLEVHSFDVRKEYAGFLPWLIGDGSLRYTLGKDNGPLPYDDGFFDGLLSCGVLEHVSDETFALAEIRRVLRPKGFFFIAHLPNRLSFTEFLARLLGQYHHERLYSARSLRSVLDESGFELRFIKRYHFLPRIKIGKVPGMGNAIDRLYQIFEALDGLLSSIPPFMYFSTAWKAVAIRRD